MDEDNLERDYSAQRERMVAEQLLTRDIRDQRVLEAMGSIPRHNFIPAEYRQHAYTDGPLPIGLGQTISQPYIVALMTQLLQVETVHNILEIGCGSGYQAAVLGHLANQVYTIERHASLADQARETLHSLGAANVFVYTGDGTLGLPEHAPFDGILVTAAAPDTPQPLLDQLSDGGRLIIPVGGQWGQYLERWTRKGKKYHQETLIPVAFVPLRGKGGWQEDAW